MNEKEVEAFKNRIRNYSFHIEQIEQINEEINVVFYDLTGVKGASYDYHVPCTNQAIKNEHRTDLLEKLEELKEKKKAHQEELDKLNAMLNQLNKTDRELVKKKLINNFTYDELSNQSYMARTTIQYRIDKAIKDIRYL